MNAALSRRPFAFSSTNGVSATTGKSSGGSGARKIIALSSGAYGTRRDQPGDSSQRRRAGVAQRKTGTLTNGYGLTPEASQTVAGASPMRRPPERQRLRSPTPAGVAALAANA